MEQGSVGPGHSQSCSGTFTVLQIYKCRASQAFFAQGPTFKNDYREPLNKQTKTLKEMSYLVIIINTLLINNNWSSVLLRLLETLYNVCVRRHLLDSP